MLLVFLPLSFSQQSSCYRSSVKEGWVEPLPQAASDRWLEWTNSQEGIKGFNVACCLKPKGYGTTHSTELHHFVKASENGYGSVSYLRKINMHNVKHVSFVLEKSRVLPLKNITVP